MRGRGVPVTGSAGTAGAVGYPVLLSLAVQAGEVAGVELPTAGAGPAQAAGWPG